MNHHTIRSHKMKKIIFIGILLGAAVFGCQLNAQEKKPVVKPKMATAKSKSPIIVTKEPVLRKIDFFSLSPDDAVQALNDELKKLKITLNDINEESSYYYDISGKRGDLLSTSRTLVFDNKFRAIITSDEDDLIQEISFSMYSGNTKHVKAVRNMMAYGGWPQIALADNDTTYKNGDIIANSSSYINKNDKGEVLNESYTVLIKRIIPYTYVPKNFKPFDPTSLNVYNNAEDIGYAIVELMKKIGINLLYKSENRPITLDEVLSNYSCDYKFSNGVSLTINTSIARKLKFIFIDSSDPITFSKLKKTLGVLQWQKTESDENDDDYYNHDNVIAIVSSYGKDIVFRINPLPGDTKTRLENTSAPTFNELVELYQGGTSDEVAESITSSYMNQIKVDTVKNILIPDPVGDKFDFYYSTSSNAYARCYFNYNNPIFNKSTRIYIGSSDLVYMKNMMAQYLSSEFRSKYIYEMKMDGKPVSYPGNFDQIWFRDKVASEQQTAQALAEKQRQDEEVARQKEQDRLDAIEKQRQRDAKSAETLKLMESILKGSFGKKQ